MSWSRTRLDDQDGVTTAVTAGFTIITRAEQFYISGADLASNQALLICVWAEKRAWSTLSAHVPTLLFKIHKLKRM